MKGRIYDVYNVTEINLHGDYCSLQDSSKKVITEIPLEVVVNGERFVNLLCLNQYQKELAVGFLYSEGVIESYEDVEKITYDEDSSTVLVDLRENIEVNQQENLRSITSGGGKSYTNINDQNHILYKALDSDNKFSGVSIIKGMQEFIDKSEIFIKVGGVHSVLLSSPDLSILTEDIGRHNALDKITGILMKEKKMEIIRESVLYLSGRVSSEMITKVIRLGVPVLVSRSTPTATAIELAQKYNVSLLGYVRGNKGYIYTSPERIEMK